MYGNGHTHNNNNSPYICSICNLLDPQEKASSNGLASILQNHVLLLYCTDLKMPVERILITWILVTFLVRE